MLPEFSKEIKNHLLKPELTMAVITDVLADVYATSGTDLRKVIKGPDKRKVGRKVAMYLCQEILDARPVNITTFFNFGHGLSELD
ncbi:hypothetical protein CJF42_23145 [Pseudoalteromonas sp. NBT06-2]|uniref:hypothetical protein n=1 Tax=Pseudoalteromonas sp. NBT06-2 TaxID=2025950 RepID=UPI000BCC0166|nr:hypothetical protein [Pseudoalteromonas sp. NBT06-2]PAJ72077.1 hypothetical protein CJF42_23145 [Pseudoalteromonas sp. NBT06-2]